VRKPHYHVFSTSTPCKDITDMSSWLCAGAAKIFFPRLQLTNRWSYGEVLWWAQTGSFGGVGPNLWALLLSSKVISQSVIYLSPDRAVASRAGQQSRVWSTSYISASVVISVLGHIRGNVSFRFERNDSKLHLFVRPREGHIKQSTCLSPFENPFRISQTSVISSLR